MKKFVIVFGIVAAFVVLATGCEQWYTTKQVINNSDYTVTFTFNHFRECQYTLKPHTSNYYSENPFTIKNYSATPPRVSYSIDFTNERVTFFNTPSRQIKIINELDRDILVTAKGAMDNEPVTVLADSEFIGSIYNNNPVLDGITATNSFPINFTYSTNELTVRAHW